MGVVHAKEALSSKVSGNNEWKSFSDVTARVDKVHFDGVQRTKDDVLLYVIEDLLQAQNFQEIVLRAHGVRQHLESLNAFKNIDIVLDTSTGDNATSEGYEVTFNITEKSRILGNVSALVGDNDGSLLLRMLLPNLLGRAESIQGEYQYGKKTTGFNVTSSKPIFGWINPTINQIVFGNISNNPWCGFQEKSKGLAAEMFFESSPQVLHTIRWEGVWRNLRCSSPITPFEIREQAGHTVKSAIKHILSMDQRDDPCLPQSGCFFRLNQEYAGLGGNVSFLKHEIQYQVNKTFLSDFTLQATVMGGLVRTLGADNKVRINDKFFLGGPLTLRGFQMHGAGPHVLNHPTGADVYWAGGVHAYAPLPFRPLRNVLDKICRTHIFLNVGNIGEFSFSEDYRKNIAMLTSQMRCSCGIGLVLAVGGIARFELNYCVPLRHEPNDRLNKGLQFGIGANFL